MHLPSPSVSPADTEQNFSKDPQFELQLRRMHRLTVYGRWMVVLLAWVLFAPTCLWSLRYEFDLLQDYFTWAAVRFGLAYNPWAAFGLAICMGLTLSTLVWQSRNYLWGLPRRDRLRLERIVCRIRQQGPSHPLWRWLFPDA